MLSGRARNGRMSESKNKMNESIKTPTDMNDKTTTACNDSIENQREKEKKAKNQIKSVNGISL